MTFILFDVETLEINIATLTFFIQAFIKYLSRQTQLWKKSFVSIHSTKNNTNLYLLGNEMVL